MTDEYLACATLGCHYLTAGTLEYCEKEWHCPFAFQRRREEDAIEQARKDAAREAERGRTDSAPTFPKKDER